MICSKLIRVATIATEGMVFNRMEDGTYNFSGVEGKYLDIILKALNLKYEMVLPEDKEGGRLLSNGNWSGMIGEITKGNADLAFNYLIVNEQRGKVVDFSTIYLTGDMAFAIQKPVAYPVSMAYIYPFDVTIWFLILALLFLMPLVFQAQFRTKYTYFNTLITFVGSLLGKSSFRDDGKLKHRMITYLWYFFGMILSFSYSAVLLSVLTVALQIPTVKNFEELAKAIEKK
ncbi:lig_chan-Glu_bd domain-containing protein [Nephila pilipes]|uniref:Lig_chan-Glu_bd domain-containing protein n=1 Tax=Nephila pilipes TaxID=299642 RepID=A0A8X6NXZ1_NEPPI|nr:lig_chan-Glu_bd domain-containing protein [Nephila pilipes]